MHSKYEHNEVRTHPIFAYYMYIMRILHKGFMAINLELAKVALIQSNLYQCCEKKPIQERSQD